MHINTLKLIIAVCLIPLLLTSCAPIQAVMLFSGGEVVRCEDCVIDFDLAGHLILIKTKINNHPKEFTFLFDSGAPTVIDGKIVEELNIKEEVEVEGEDGGGNPTKIKLVKINSMIIGDVEVKDIGAAVFDFDQIRRLSEVEVDGIIGNNAVKFFKITIDYQNKTFAVSNKTESEEQVENGYKMKFEEELMNGFAPKIKCFIDASIEAEAVIDTGLFGYVDVPISLLRDNNYDDSKYIKVKGAFRWSAFGPKTEDNFFRIRSFKVNDLEINNFVAFVSESPTGKCYIGSMFLDNFVTIINYPAHELILIPIGDINFKKNVFSSGLAMKKDENDRVVVCGFWENSPADKSEIEIGDEILEINSKSVEEISISEWTRIDYFTNDVKTVDFKIRSKNGKKSIVLQKDWLLPHAESEF